MSPGKIHWEEVIKRGVESDTLDYKSALNWRLLPRSGKMKFVRHALAMANTKGGFVVVGVGEDAAGRPALFTGLTEEESASFDPSIVGSFINHYVDPPIDLTIERPIVEGKRYAIFHIRPFRDIPHVCSSGFEHELLQGVFYIRTPDASSRPAYRASEIHDLLRRAMRNQRVVLGKMLRDLLRENYLFEPKNRKIQKREEAQSHFEEEIRHALSAFRKLPGSSSRKEGNLAFAFAMMPGIYTPERFSFADLQKFREKLSLYPGGEFFPEGPEKRKEYLTNVACRIAAEGSLCQLHKSGLLFFASFLPLSRGEILQEKTLLSLLEKSISFAGSWAKESSPGKSQFHIQLQFFPEKPFLFQWGEKGKQLHSAGKEVITLSCTAGRAALQNEKEMVGKLREDFLGFFHT